MDYWDTPDGRPAKSKSIEPLKVTYVWQEGGGTKRHVHTAKKSPSKYTISCGTKPVMKSIIVEMAE